MKMYLLLNLDGGFKYPYLGKISNFTHMFQMGWNQPAETYGDFFQPANVSFRGSWGKVFITMTST